MRVLFRSSTRTPDSRIEHLVSARRDPRRRIERRHIERAAEVGRVGAEAGIIAVAIEPVDDVVGAAGAVVADVAQIIRIVRIRPLAIEQLLAAIIEAAEIGIVALLVDVEWKSKRLNSSN